MYHVEQGVLLRDESLVVVMRGRHITQGPVLVGDEVKELQERLNSLGLAPRREQVMCQVEFVVFPHYAGRGRP